MSNAYSIAVVDDDESVREAVEALLKSMDFRVQTYSSAESFLSCPRRAGVDCLILDVRMEPMSGPQLQQMLNAEHCAVSII